MKYFLLFASVLFSLHICCQPIRLRSLSTKDGLSQNSVNQIFQDSRGYIWFATQDGLNRYNGYDFKIFRPNSKDPYSISDNFIIQIQEDSLGRLWISTRAGIDIYSPADDKFHKLKVNLGTLQHSFLNLHKGYAYFFNPSDEACRVFRVPVSLASEEYERDDRVESYLEFNCQDYLSFLILNDSLWLIGQSKALNTVSQQVYNFEKVDFIPWVQSWDTYSISDSIFLIGDDKSLATFNPKNGQLKQFNKKMGGLSFLEMSRDEVWIGSDKGLFEFSLSNGTLNQINSEPDLSNCIIHHLLLDNVNQVWIGTANKGVFTYNLKGMEFSYLETDSKIVWGAFETENQLALLTDDGIYQGNQRYLAGNRILSGIVDSEGTQWIGNLGGDILKKEAKASDFHNSAVQFDFKTPVTCFLEDKRGNIWVGSYRGLMKISKNGEVKKFAVSLKNRHYLLSIYEDRNGIIWLGNNTGCAYIKVDDEIVNIYFKADDPKSLPFDFSTGFAEDTYGNLWIATYGGGISRLNSDSTFTNFTESQGLSSNVIHDMEVDQKGIFWMISNGGLSSFNPTTLEFVNFNESDGLKSRNFSIGSGHAFSDGRIGFGSVEGLLIFNPDSIEFKGPTPSIVWESIFINYEEWREEIPNEVNEFELNDNDRVFSIEFAALNFIDPEDVGYEFMLEGFDKDWVSTTSQNRRISYSTLPYNSYELKVRVYSRKNHFEPNVRSLSLRVNPPFWLSWWFLLLMTFGILSTLAVVVFYLSRRQLKKRLRELETEAKIQSERERISRDLHDSVGAHFTFIISKLDFMHLSWTTENDDHKQKFLSEVTDFARSGMKLLRETIWALTQEAVDKDSFRTKVNDFLSLTCGGMKLKHLFHFRCVPQRIGSIVALNCFRIIQEAVTNSIKHSNATVIEVDFRLEEGMLELTISDNGHGFKTQEASDGFNHFGISNMKKRVSDMKAELTIESSINGTTIKVSKYTPN